MPEYIEREAAIRAVVEAVDNGLATTAEDLEEILGDLPAAEVEPVRHGKWEKPSDKRRKSSLLCSVCYSLTYASYDFCPNCGAKMGR